MDKAVGWIDTDLILVLVNTYSLNYIWSSSQVFAYNVTIPNSFDVISIFPNIQQTLTATFGPILLSLVITQNGTAVMLDSDGNYYILLPSPAGSFSNSSPSTSLALALLEVIILASRVLTLSSAGRLLSQQPSCTLQLTKVINHTYSLEEDGETQFSGVWLPVFTESMDEMFVDENEYKYATSSITVLSIVISETSYYTLNIQWPITDKDELIFNNLLSTIVCLEIFGLGLLIFKLIIIPLLKWVCDYCCRRFQTKKSSENNLDLPEILVRI
ncbi:unnamed protein product [Didymodactylos carnosus]|uniref:Uncharacterized protein n=2 Tax=Didymodactylos carnosus TaxID=1234261 RepID=A0A815UKW1_9BILA|nr:unnamed protein product [Didymodactylos carnosus]CAF4377235.1 unnamed protein product [Didymodactylos carnosus]